MQTLDCGHEPSPHSEHTTGTAYTVDDREICWTCADAETREQMRTSDRVLLYLKNDHVITWSGGIMGRVTSRVTRTHYAMGWKYDRVYLQVTDLDGKRWFGTSPGDEMYCRLRAKRVATPVVPDPEETKRARGGL